MFRKLLSLTIVCVLFQIFVCQNFDSNICPNGLTPSPSDSQWPTIIPNRFEIFAELSTNVETFEVRQSFINARRDSIHFRNGQNHRKMYYDFVTNEMFTINEQLQCERSSIKSDEFLPFITNQYLKPSVLLGFNGRDYYSPDFFTQYLGEETIRNGILTKKFQSCFYIYQDSITINATYYLGIPPPNVTSPPITPDIVQIDVRTNNYQYTYNIIRYVSSPSLSITTPSGAYCPNRINTKDFPKNLPSHLLLHAEAYTLKTQDTESRVESFNRFIDEKLKFERIDYSIGKVLEPPPPDELYIDYASGLTYLYTRATQQCTVMNSTNNVMGTTNEMLFQFGANDDSIQFQYTGLTTCGRKQLLCHRWIGQRNLTTTIQLYEWYWSARYNDIDLAEFIPIKVNVLTTYIVGPPRIINQEMSLFNYNPRPNSMEVIDSTLGECYRALGPSHNYNYAILRMTLNNDAKYPVHQHLLTLQNRLHMQLANDLRIRHTRLSSFVIDTTDQRDKDVYVTFTLLDNPPVSSSSFQESSSLELIRHLARQINNGNFYVRDDDGAFDLQARPNSLRTLVLYLLPSENHTNYFNETVFVYHNVTQTVVKLQQKIVYRSTGPQIAALWTGFALLGLIVALAIGSFIAVRKWTPNIKYQQT